MLRIAQITRPLSRNLRSFSVSSSTSSASSSDEVGRNPPPNQQQHPIKRTFQVLRNDLRKLKDFLMPSKSSTATNDGVVEGSNLQRLKGTGTVKGEQGYEGEFQTHCDVLVIGGGGVGSSVAYWLKRQAREGLNVVVVEQDATYSRASTVLSVGGLRQQFSLPENIQMSLYGADLIREAKETLGDCDLNFTPHGYLLLASEEGAEALKRNSNLQNELGARNELLTAERLKTKFPWLNTKGIALGCHGLEKEGWFDPWALLMGFKNKAREYGAHYVSGEVVDFEFKNQPDIIIEGDPKSSMGTYDGLDKAVIKMPDGELRTIKFALCVLAAGAASGKVARMARIGTGSGLLRVPLPVEPRKRYVYVFNTQGTNAPGLGTPLTISPDGTYFRRDGLGGNYLCGRSPRAAAEPECDNLNVDHEYFETDVWPTLAERVPAFESAKVCGSWAGFYEYNLFDENGIIGPHAYYNNLYIATGFSGHGIQQTPAVGRAISELIIDGQFRTIDLTRLGFDRLIVDRPMFETGIF